jgi:serine protease
MQAGRPLIRAGVLATALFAPFALEAPRAESGPVVAAAAHARVIVKYREGSALMQPQAATASAQHTMRAQALGRRLGLQMESGRALSDRAQVVVARGLTSAELAARLAAQGDVEYAVPDERKYIVAAPNDPLYQTRAIAGSNGGPDVGQWYLKPPGPAGTAARTAPSAINAEQAWDLTLGSASIVVAVLDTGLRFDHPDLQGGNVLPGYDMISADNGNTNTDFRTANDGNGRDPDASDPGDFVTSAEANDSSSPLYQCRPEPTSSWHGTQTLGLIGAATNNGLGMAGVGRSVRVMPIRVLGKCGGYDSDILAGMRWAAGLSVPGLPVNPNPARVINLSLGGTGSCSAAYASETANLTAAGVVVVASAGNSAGRAVGTPANCAGVIAVAGIRHIGTKVGFSDLGPQIAISAPGGNCVNIGNNEPCLYPMVTTTNAGSTTPVAGGIYSDAFAPSLGTSFASPLVAGAAALMLSERPTLTPAEVKSKLQSTARPFPTSALDEGGAAVPVCTPANGVDQLQCVCTTSLCGAGMLDVRAALLATVSVQARISIDTEAPTAGTPVTLSSSSLVGSGRAVASYQWALVDGGGIVSGFIGATNANTASVLPSGAGTFTVSLTTVDDLGVSSTATQSVSVEPVPSGDSDGGGGGALGAEWLLLLLSAVLALAGAGRVERRSAAISAAATRPDRG